MRVEFHQRGNGAQHGAARRRRWRAVRAKCVPLRWAAFWMAHCFSSDAPARTHGVMGEGCRTMGGGERNSRGDRARVQIREPRRQREGGGYFNKYVKRRDWRGRMDGWMDGVGKTAGWTGWKGRSGAEGEERGEIERPSFTLPRARRVRAPSLRPYFLPLPASCDTSAALQ